MKLIIWQIQNQTAKCNLSMLKIDIDHVKPEFLVLLGVCTHLGCSPLYKPGENKELGLEWKGGFFCPCHGSKFDLSGRVFKGMPAGNNLEVPPYYFASETKLIVGEDRAS